MVRTGSAGRPDTAVFSVANSLRLRPPAGVAAPERLVDINRSERPYSRLMHRLARDLHDALRAQVKTPGAAIIIVMTFALGSAGVTTMFALVNAILIQPLPYPQSDRLVAIEHSAPGLGLSEAGLSSGTYFHYRDHAQSFEAIAIYSETALNLSSPETGTERVSVTYASPELFTVLGVTPILGRLFTHDDGGPGFMDLTWTIPVLLSHEFWQGRFGADPGIVGRTITLNNRARRVVGVLPPRFAFPRAETQIWMMSVPPGRTANFANRFDDAAIARLRPGISAAAAEAELVRILPSIEGVYRDATAARLAEVRLAPHVVPLKEEMVGNLRAFLWLLLGGTALLLLVACANTATLYLLRAEHRTAETAIRSALGARPSDLIGLFVSEAALLSLAGTILGLMLVQAALSALAAFTPIMLPRLGEVALDGWVLAFACGLAALGMLLFGGLSFLRQSIAASTATILNASTRMTDSAARLRARDLLVAAQVALALLLLAGSGLMVQSFWRLTRVEPGFNASGLLTIEIGLPSNRASQHQRIYDGLAETLRALPGVERVAAASSLPLDGATYRYPFAIGVPPSPTETPLVMKFVVPGYFQVMGTRVLEGASFARDERIAAHGVVVSDAFARRFFPAERAIGKTISRLDADGQPVEMFDRLTRTPQPIASWTIVGVAGDVHDQSLRVAPDPIVYVPVIEPAVEPSIVPTSMTFVIRATRAPESLIGSVRTAIREHDPSLSIARIRTMEDIVAQSLARERFLAGLLVVAAAMSLFLGAIGVYGVAAEAVRRRTQEIAIRVSLGAQPAQIVQMVLRGSIVFVLAGTAFGLILALAATRTLRAFLFEVSATDPLTLAAVTTLVIGAALLAHLLPARRAVQLDPATSLRQG